MVGFFLLLLSHRILALYDRFPGMGRERMTVFSSFVRCPKKLPFLGKSCSKKSPQTFNFPLSFGFQFFRILLFNFRSLRHLLFLTGGVGNGRECYYSLSLFLSSFARNVCLMSHDDKMDWQEKKENCFIYPKTFLQKYISFNLFFHVLFLKKSGKCKRVRIEFHPVSFISEPSLPPPPPPQLKIGTISSPPTCLWIEGEERREEGERERERDSVSLWNSHSSIKGERGGGGGEILPGPQSAVVPTIQNRQRL